MRRVLTIFLVLGFAMISCTKPADKPSAQERLVAQKLLNYGEIVTPNDVAAIKNPSPLFPYIRGLLDLKEGRYEAAHNVFVELIKKYPQSTVLRYYAGLSEYGVEHSMPLPELVHAFAEHLNHEHILSYVARGGERQNYVEDPFFKLIREAYDPSVKEIEQYQERIRSGMKGWFDARENKQPFDYILYASLGELGKEKALAVLQEGLQRHPNNRPLLMWLVGMGIRSTPRAEREKYKKTLSKLDDELYYALVQAALSCEYDDRDDVEVGDIYAPPLCDKEIAMLDRIAPLSAKPSPPDIRKELVAYYKDNVASRLSFDPGMTSMFLLMPQVGSFIDILDLSRRILVSTALALEKRDFDTAAKYLHWNRYIYKAFAEPGRRVLLSTMVRLTIAEQTWAAEMDVLKKQQPQALSAQAELGSNLTRIKALLSFYMTYVTQGPLFMTSGPAIYGPYEAYEATRPLWVDKAF